MENGKETTGELNDIFHYPSVAELFASGEPRRVDEFCAGLEQKKHELESLIRRGTREEAARATTAVRGVDVTIAFIKELKAKVHG